MPNLAARLRNKAVTRWGVEGVVLERKRKGIIMEHPDDAGKSRPRRIQDLSLAPIHTRGGDEIDTDWVASTSPWDWEITAADYKTKAKDAFNGAPLLQFSSDAQETEWVTLQPRQLDWHNDRGDVLPAGIVQNVSPQRNGERLLWTDAWGSGRHFEYVNAPSWLVKNVIIDSYGSLPAPTNQILTGGNPVLRSQFQFDWSSALTVWVNGDTQWTGRGNAPTLDANKIEFRRADNSVAFTFSLPMAWSSSEDDAIGQAGILRVSKSGNNILVEVRVSQAWLASASYPVKIDPNIDITVAASGDDGDARSGNSSLETSGSGLFLGYHTVGSIAYRDLLLFFDGVTGLSGATINVATLDVTVVTPNSNIAKTLSVEDAASPTVATTYAGWAGKSRAGGIAYTGQTSGGAKNIDISTPIQYLADNYDPTAFSFFTDDNGQSTASTQQEQWSTYDNASDIPAIHVEYTAGGGSSESISFEKRSQRIQHMLAR